MSKLSLGVEQAAVEPPATRAVARLAEADRALSAAIDAASAVPLVAQGKLLAEWARAVHAGEEHQRQAHVFVLRAMRNAGQRLAEAQQRGELRRPGDNVAPNPIRNVAGSDIPPGLSDLGVTRDESSDWQRLAETYTDAELVDVAGTMERPSLGGVLPKPQGHLSALMTSDSPEWYTPPEVIAAVVTALGAIDLDPCSNPGTPNVPAARHFTAEDDGLAQAWGGRVYMNPPYGRGIGEWIEKLGAEYRARHVAAAVALLPARIDTAWWRGLPFQVWCGIAGRLTFSGYESAAPFPSAAVYVGDDAETFTAAFRHLGDLWRRA